MNRNRLFGIGEPITMRHLAGQIDQDKALDILEDLGVSALREWVFRTGPELENPDPAMAAAYRHLFDRCRQMDVEVTGVSSWTLAAQCPQQDRSAMPGRDRTPGSAYMRTLEATEKAWERLAALFPQVPQWEVGNEWNYPLFLHPMGWRPGKPSFSIEEAMAIAADLCFVSARGIKKGNPSAKVVSFSPTPDAMGYYLPAGVPRTYGIAVALERLYRCITRGESFSTDPNEYFDLVAWHPYLSTQMGYAPVQEHFPARNFYQPDELPDALWKSYNDAAYDVMARYGDGDKPVLLTEFGFSDAGDPEREAFQAGLIRLVFEQLKTMPYVKTLHFFRLFEDERSRAGENGVFTNESESKFGIVREGHHEYAYRNKARVLREIYRGEKG